MNTSYKTLLGLCLCPIIGFTSCQMEEDPLHDDARMVADHVTNSGSTSNPKGSKIPFLDATTKGQLLAQLTGGSQQGWAFASKCVSPGEEWTLPEWISDETFIFRQNGQLEIHTGSKLKYPEQAKNVQGAFELTYLDARYTGNPNGVREWYLTITSETGFQQEWEIVKQEKGSLQFLYLSTYAPYLRIEELGFDCDPDYSRSADNRYIFELSNIDSPTEGNTNR